MSTKGDVCKGDIIFWSNHFWWLLEDPDEYQMAHSLLWWGGRFEIHKTDISGVTDSMILTNTGERR